MRQIVTDIPDTITQDDLDKLRASNREEVRKLAMGNQAINPIEVLATRIETFIDTFLGEEDRIVFEYNFEYRMGRQLDEAVAARARTQLMQGVNNSTGVKSLF